MNPVRAILPDSRCGEFLCAQFVSDGRHVQWAVLVVIVCGYLSTHGVPRPLPRRYSLMLDLRDVFVASASVRVYDAVNCLAEEALRG